MSPITHLLISWSVANISKINRRERTLVTLAGVVPDIDGAGLIIDIFCHGSDQPLQLWSKHHHILGHNIGFGLLLMP
jgi:inner membrane protein